MAKIIYNVKDYRNYGIDEIMIEGCMGCYHSTAKTVAEACEEYYSLYQQRVEKEKRDALRMEMRDREAEKKRLGWGDSRAQRKSYAEEQTEIYGGYESVKSQVYALAKQAERGKTYREHFDYTDSGEGGIGYIYISPIDGAEFVRYWDFTTTTDDIELYGFQRFEKPDSAEIADWFAKTEGMKTNWEKTRRFS